MSVSSSRHTTLLDPYDEVHSVIVDEPTPSPPPKPPRGIMRKGAPMKPQRSAIKIDPIENDKENTKLQQQSQFKAKEIMDQMQTYFKRSIAVIRTSEAEFTGAEAADVLTAYIQSHKDDFPKENVGRSNAIKLLEIWRQQNVIFCTDPHQKRFVDSERAFYRLGGEQEQTLYIASSPAPSRMLDESTNVSRSSSTRRSNSFKRLFSPLVRRNRSNSRNREKETTKETSTLFKSTWSLFSSSDKHEKKARRAEQQLVREEEAEIYELALFHLLSLIDVEFLEDVALPVQDVKKNASFLSSIMEKVGLGGNDDRLDPQQEEEMDLLIETHPLIRDASPWFQAARCCAPLLHLHTTPETSQKMQLFLWCKAALTAVSSRLEKMTQNGISPLFPVEFAPLLTKIAQQLINDLNSGEKLGTAVMYLFLMVPHPLRKAIDELIHWLQLTMRTDAVEDLRSPYYLGRTEPRHKENVKVITEELRTFVFPKGSMTNAQQDIFIETLVELRMAGRLGQRPSELENSLRAKHSSEGDLTPVRFAVARDSMRSKKKDEDGLTETESALVKMMESCLDDKKVSLTDKKKQLANFQKCYPVLYNRFFHNML